MDLLTVNDRPGQYPDSYYAATTEHQVLRQKAEGRIDCDICIVGGGYTGVSTALHLAERGLNVVLLEANRLGWGASGRNGGQVNTGMRLDQESLEGMFGVDTARKLWAVADQAVSTVKQLIADHGIDCGFKPGVVHAAHRARYLGHERRLVEKMRKDYGVETLTFLNRAELLELVPSNFYHGGVLDLAAGHLHPLKYLLGLVTVAETSGARIFENSRVTAIHGGPRPRVITDSAEISCQTVVVGCNGYTGGLLEDISRHVMPINGFIAATRPLSPDEVQGVLRRDYAVADSKFVINYYRLSQDKRLLFGGGEAYGYRFPKNIAAMIRKPLAQVYPQLANIEFDYTWGGTLGITMSRMPYFHRHQGSILSASGFSGQGVALGTFAGKILADAIGGESRVFDLLAALPAKAFPGGRRFQSPLLFLAMSWYALRDRFA
jgi:gamma-glutamylputrescine oxidase